MTFDAYCRSSLAKQATPIKTKPPTQKLKPEDIDPYQSANNKKLLKRLHDICLPLPETSQGLQFGTPCLKAGKKTFCSPQMFNGHMELQIWVGPDRQIASTSFDDRYRIPGYIGRNDWISFNLSGSPNWREVKSLIRESYRHFANKRMLLAMDESDS